MSETIPPPAAQPPTKVAYKRLLWVWLVAGATALVVNALFLINAAKLLRLTISISLPGNPQPAPLTVLALIPFCFIPALVAALLLALLGRTTQRPFRNFLIISLALLLFSFAIPLSLPLNSLTQFILCGMEVVIAASVVGVLYTLGRADFHF
jgi:hypothetical protein